MRVQICLGVGLLLCGVALADDIDDRAKLMGSWSPEDQGGAAWSFSPQGDSMKVTQTESGNKVADFVCATNGKSCEVKLSGKKATVSFWYNGAKLVELEQQGSEVVERRFLPAENSMELEVVPMVPSGKAETIKFKRSSPLASAK